MPRKLLFVATEDWFFASHFLPMARAAREMGFDVAVIARERHHRKAIEATGARLIALEAERRSLDPRALWRQVVALRRLIAAERPDILHCIALKPIALAGLAGKLAGVERRVYALTGLGFLGARKDMLAAIARFAAISWLRGAIDGRQVRFLFENPDDPVTLGLDPQDASKVAIVGGAGVDPLILMPSPMPPAPPLKVALVARMLWSKGVDLAVEAVRLARAERANVTLTIHGAPDPSNPKAIPEATLTEWAARPGIAWAGPTRDIEAVWAAHHLCILPSRGGEGLPRTILEAAACGRPILTTDVPGCRSFVRDGQDGMVVPADDAAALAKALVRFAHAPNLVERMGSNARDRLLDGHTERDVMNAVKALYLRLLEAPAVDVAA
ncbi:MULTISPECIES: glycosyltransferase family 4 protein [unclassified Bosea (in: a-proteobacteria)]|uniref:glycosyltransferase family 4 protein n=1 Tax=unclassified Bosea (in: a-proteobacteria) TaxID=2653178 RepID=UPI000953B7ED|nr:MULTISPECIES: glycosyltransferase family 4 protein [unclassified Bosea (in: a-proteobacteria)]TAJ28780.1 MAG: glycosyltransferase family 1 protein [Bosea sp. (in: a-proteobacteria)]SIR49352.1 Glycosyltransferase involved in cell wall bisynthesis [Bosea sp. TND4EK4]